MGSVRRALPPCTEVQGFSRGKALTPLLELQSEPVAFAPSAIFTSKNSWYPPREPDSFLILAGFSVESGLIAVKVSF